MNDQSLCAMALANDAVEEPRRLLSDARRARRRGAGHDGAAHPGGVPALRRALARCRQPARSHRGWSPGRGRVAGDLVPVRQRQPVRRLGAGRHRRAHQRDRQFPAAGNATRGGSACARCSSAVSTSRCCSRASRNGSSSASAVPTATPWPIWSCASTTCNRVHQDAGAQGPAPRSRRPHADLSATPGACAACSRSRCVSSAG